MLCHLQALSPACGCLLLLRPAGALVAGPDAKDVYVDDRTTPGARVAAHYSAALLSALAGVQATDASSKRCGQLQGLYQQLFQSTALN